jgi:hypothetical protein
VRAVRSTLLLSSRASLTERGLFDTYERSLSPEAASAMKEIIAGTWLPIDLVMQHYRACDALGLSRADQVALGRTNGERLSGTLLGTLAKLARSAGTTPLMLIEQFPRFWGRIFEGGELSFDVRGPKDVNVVVHAPPIVSSPHFRNGLAGTAESIVGLVSTRLFVRIRRFDDREGTSAYLMQWA